MSLSTTTRRHLLHTIAVGAVAATTVGVLVAPSAVAAPADATRVAVVVELATPASVDALTADQRTTLHTRAQRQNRGEVGKADAATVSRENAATAALGGARTKVRSAQQSFLTTAGARGVTVTAPTTAVDLVDAVFGEVAETDLAVLAALPGVLRVSRDVPMTASRGVGATPSGTTLSAAAPTTNAGGGAGTVIAVVDTGVDYTLPDLGAGFGPGHKVVAGHDFVGNDDDPMDDNAHGTHVAGIAAGTGAASITGAAPAARLTAWKALNGNGLGTSAAVVRGLEAAVDPTGAYPADVVNLSLGGPGDGSDVVSRAADAAAAGGVVVVAAAGNSGPDGGTIGAPGVSPSVLTVGASTTDLRLATARVLGTNRDLPTWRVAWSANAAAAPTTARVVDAGDGRPADYAAAGDVRGAVVTYRGYAPRSTDEYPGNSYAQARLAQKNGAIAAIVRMPSEVPAEPGGGVSAAQPEPGVFAAAADGAAGVGGGGDYRFRTVLLLGTYESDYAAIADTVTAGTARIRLTPVDATDQIASFSSRGPAPDLSQKPDLVAPGVEILSTVPAAFGIPDDVYRLSGTSMASPAVAGAAAVLRGRFPDLTEAQVRARLTGSAAKLRGTSATLPASVQGAGRLDLRAALAATVTASPAVVSFGLASPTTATTNRRTVTVTNSGAAAVTATLTVAPSTGSQGAATVSPARLTLAAGRSADVVVAATSSANGGDTDLTGEVVATLSDGSSLRIPYSQSTRTVVVRGTPTVTTGPTQIMVNSPVALDSRPTVVLRNDATGAERPVVVTKDATMPGWYRGDITLPAVGTYTVTAVGRHGGVDVPGTAALERVRPLRDGTWQRIGRAATSGDLAVSTAHAGTAVQSVPDSARPFVTTDRGKTWRQVASMPVGDGDGKAVMDRNDPNAFWYALDAAPGFPPRDPTYAGKVLRTTDLGRTWTVLPFPDEKFWAFVGGPGVLAAVVDRGVEVSRDGGASWTLLPFTWPQTPVGATIADGALLVGSYDRVWRVDRIASASPAAPRIVSRLTGGGLVGISASAGTAAVAEFDGTVRVSHDGGATWTARRIPSSFASSARVLGTELFVSTTSGYQRSADDGRTWTLLPYPVDGPVGVDLERWPDRPRSLLMPLENAGLWESADDGRTARRIGVSSTSVQQVVTVPLAGGRTRVVVADEQGVGSLVMQAAGPVDETAWGITGGEARLGVAATDVVVDPRRPSSWTRIRLDASNNAELQRSADSGRTWTTIGPQTFGLSLRGLTLDPADSAHAAVGYRTANETGVLVTDDGWATWRAQPYAGVRVRDVLLDPVRPGRIWIAADQGLYRSDDDGRTVRQVAAGETTSVWVDARGRRVLAGGTRIQVSDDAGATFTTATGTGTEVLIDSFAAVTATLPGTTTARQVLFAGSDVLYPHEWRVDGRGVLRSVDGGRTWTSVSAGLQSLSVASMAVTADSTWLVVGTRQGGVHRAAIADLLG